MPQGQPTVSCDFEGKPSLPSSYPPAATRSGHMAPELLSSTLGALKRDLLMFSPYFVPGEHGVIMLTDLEERGVQVRVLTNSLASTDVGAIHAGYAKYRKPLLRGEWRSLNSSSRRTPRRGAFSISSGVLGAPACMPRRPSLIGRRSLWGPRIWIRAPAS